MIAKLILTTALATPGKIVCLFDYKSSLDTTSNLAFAAACYHVAIGK